MVLAAIAVPAQGATPGGATSSAAPTDPNLGQAQTFDIMNVPEALDRAAAYGRAPLQEVTVMAGDTGLDLDHPDIAPRLFQLPGPVPAPSQYPGFVNEMIPAGASGWDMIGDGGNPCID